MCSSNCLCNTLAGPGANLHSRCFGEIWLFEDAPLEARSMIGQNLTRRHCDIDDVIFRQDDDADSMYLIKSGSVKLWKITDDGRELTLDIRKAGDLLGESVLMEDARYPVFASALTPVSICGLNKATFEDLISAHPQVGLSVIRNLSKRIDYLTGKLESLSEPSIEDRLYKVLVNVAEQVGTPNSNGWNIAFALTHEDIGFLVGAHRVSITRAMKKLKALGRVSSQGKYLFVTAPAL